MSVEEVNNFNEQELYTKMPNLEGIGSGNSLLKGIVDIMNNRLKEWEIRYSEEEFPEKIIINSIYQSLQLHYLCNNLDIFFKGKKIENLEEALNEVEVFKNKNLSDVRTKVDSYFKSNIKIGSLDPKLCKDLIKKHFQGDDNAIKEIFKIYLWYSGAFELGVYFCALGLLGHNKKDALENLLEIVLEFDMSDIKNAQMLFGNNISLLFNSESLSNLGFTNKPIFDNLQDVSENILKTKNIKESKLNNRFEDNQNSNYKTLDNQLQLEGLGSRNFILNEIYSSMGLRAKELLLRYPDNYHEKLVLNSIYQSLQLEYLLNNIEYFFQGKRYDTVELASKEVNSFKSQFLIEINSKVEDYYESNTKIGSLDPKKCKNILNDFNNDVENSFSELLKIYFWYSGAFEIGLNLCTYGLLGYDFKYILNMLLDVVIDIDIKNLKDVHTLFGSNISLLFNPIKKDREFNYRIVKNFVEVISKRLELTKNIKIHNIEVKIPHFLSKVNDNNKSIEEFDCIVVDDYEKPYVSYKSYNKFSFNSSDLEKDIFLCIISIESREGYLIKPNGEIYIEQEHFDNELKEYLSAPIGMFGGYEENGKQYKEYSWIVIE